MECAGCLHYIQVHASVSDSEYNPYLVSPGELHVACPNLQSGDTCRRTHYFHANIFIPDENKSTWVPLNVYKKSRTCIITFFSQNSSEKNYYFETRDYSKRFFKLHSLI